MGQYGGPLIFSLEHATNENIIIFHICGRNLNFRRLMCCKNGFSYLLSVKNYRLIFGHFLYASSKNKLTFYHQRPFCYEYEWIAVTGTEPANSVVVLHSVEFHHICRFVSEHLKF